jgi:radical SAM-linked protein
MVRYRVEFGKTGRLIYTSNLDVARMWERTLRRAQAPVVYSQGYTPHPRIQIAAAMPLGFSSECEMMDVWLEESARPPGVLLPALREKAPEGLEVKRVWAVDVNGPALQTLTTQADYRITLKGTPISADVLKERVAHLLARETIMVEGKRRPKDMRPRLLALSVTAEEPLTLQLRGKLSQQEGHLRPDHVLEWLGLDPLSARIHRERIYYADPIGASS